MIALYDDPGLIDDICKTFLSIFLLEYYGTICADVEVDCILIWKIWQVKWAYLSHLHILKDS